MSFLLNFIVKLATNLPGDTSQPSQPAVCAFCKMEDDPSICGKLLIDEKSNIVAHKKCMAS